MDFGSTSHGRQTHYCPACGSAVAGERFCRYCGRALDDRTGRTSGRPRSRFAVGAVILALTVALAGLAVALYAVAGGGSGEATKPPAAGVAGAESAAEDSSRPAFADQEVARRFGGAIYRVESTGCGTASGGSAFAISERHLVTNWHVVAIDPNPSVISRNGRRLPGRVIGSNDEADVAVVEVALDLGTTLRWAETSELQEGQRLVAIGYPLPAGAFSVTPGGIVSFLEEAGRRTGIRTDAAIDRGNSGGPALTSDGEVAGVVTMMDLNLEGFQLVPILFTADHLRPSVEAILASPRDVRAECGRTVRTVPDEWSGGVDWDEWADGHGRHAPPGEAHANAWIAVLASLPTGQHDHASAEQRRVALAAQYGAVSLLASGDFASLRPGYWVIYASGFRNGEDAVHYCRSVGRRVPQECYGRYLSHDPGDDRIAT